jgi:hypothetical protein
MSEPDETTENLEDAFDRLVAEYADRCGRGGGEGFDDLLERVPAEARPALANLLQMARVGGAWGCGAGDAHASATDEPLQVPEPLAPGVTLGGHVLERVLGRGAIGTVWLARDPELQRSVAIKVLRPALALEARQVDRFRREALAVARLRHPAIVPVFAVGRDRGNPYFVMEFVEGSSLGELLDRAAAAGDARDEVLARSLVPGERRIERAAAHVLAEVARALVAAHEAGVLHRDVKPSNILIGRDGRVRLADFGLAHADGEPALSTLGEPLGTPYYMSPEQVELHGAALDARTDVYSLGVTLYEVLCGQRPFSGDSVIAVFDAIRSESPPPDIREQRPSTDADAAAIVRRAMARARDERYASAAELADDLDLLASGQPTRAAGLESGIWRQVRRAFASARGGHPVHYRSPRTLLGWPLVEIRLGRAPGKKLRAARGWIAFGDVAIGGLAFGNALGVGLFAFGGAAGVGVLGGLGGAMGTGLFALGGGLALGGLAVGGGAAAGLVALGGGLAIGYYAFGAIAMGVHVVSAQVVDPEARALFERLPWIGDWVRGVLAGRGR